MNNMKVFKGIGNFFIKTFTSIRRFFKRKYDGLWTLTIMQLKDKLNFSFNADKKGALTKLIIYAILFVVVTAVISFVFYLFNMLSIFGALEGTPISVFNFAFIIMLLLSTLSCISKLTNSLYFSKDNLVLLSYPVKPNVVFLSKLFVFYLIELIKSVTYYIPLFFAYGIIYKFQIIYFPWVILLFFIIAFIPVIVASLFSIPFMFIKMSLIRRPFMQDVSMLAILIGLTVLIFWGINLIPDNLHFLSQWSMTYRPQFVAFTNNFEVIMYPFYFISSLLIGCTQDVNSPYQIKGVFTPMTGWILLILVASLIALSFLSYYVTKPLFYKIAVKPFEYNKKIIFHNFNRPKYKFESSYSEAFVLQDEENPESKHKLELRFKLEKALNEIVKQAGLFKNQKVYPKKIIRLLEKQTGLKFKTVPVEEFIDKYQIGYFVEDRNEIKHLVLARSIDSINIECYDPNYLKNQNNTRRAFISAMWKDILIDVRTPGKLVENYVLLMIIPIAIALLNRLFASINTSFLGVSLTIMFNILIMTLIPVSSNVMFASIYSREGESAYLLKAAPINYVRILTTKLVLRELLVSLSLLITCIIYRYYASDFTRIYIRPLWLFVGIDAVYLAHLIWSAELDYMNPQDKLYSETGEGNISNPNETISTILAYVITAIFTFISYFFLRESMTNAFYKIAGIGVAFLLIRILLFFLKIQAYRTSRGERGRD